MGNSFHDASSLCHTSSIIFVGEGWWSSISQQPKTRFSMGDRSEARAGQGNNRIPLYLGRTEHNVRHVVLYYLVSRGRSAGLDGRAQLLDTRIQASEYCMQNWTPLKRRHCTTPVSSFVVRRTRVNFSLCATFSREAEEVVHVLTIYAAAYAVAPYEWMLGVLQKCSFSD
ncbi:hypothetical protein TNCV_1594011 [Trichonephila clavipes]|nr:hypothetical protein TNCV_1594011 [Trichonephila clavipes]